MSAKTIIKFNRLIVLLSFGFVNTVQAVVQNYFICEGVQSAYFSNPVENKAMVINYDLTNGNFVLLRCLSTDGTQNLSCYIAGLGNQEELCIKERENSRVARVVYDLVEFGVSSFISGGASTLGKVQQTISTIRDLKLNPECIGTSLMTSMALGVTNYDQYQKYFDIQTEIGPLTGLTRFANRNLENKMSYIFTELNNGIHPRSNAVLSDKVYFKTQRDGDQIDRLAIESGNTADFCAIFGPRLVYPSDLNGLY